MRRFVPLSVNGVNLIGSVLTVLGVAAAAAEVETQGTREHFIAAPVLTQVRLHRWDSRSSDRDVSSEAGPYLPGLMQYARGMSHAARGDVAAARIELDHLQRSRRAAEKASLTVKTINRASDVLVVARWQLQSAIAMARQKHGDAVRFARAAVVAEDRLVADDPPVWPVTSRHMLGNALLSADRAAEAQKVFSEDLRKYPHNCTASAGLAAAELAQRSALRAAPSAQLSAHPLHCPK